MALRHLGFLLIGAVLLEAQVAPAGNDAPKCAIEGRVLSLAGEALKKATLQLRPIPNGPPNLNYTNTIYSATTGADGKFAIHDLPAATYFLDASRVGYIRQSYGAKTSNAQGTRLKLEAGQEMKDLVIQLMPQGMIYGKVVDEDGEPVPSTQISVQRWMYVNGIRQLRPVNYGNSQADGTFVIGSLAPGRYVMNASVNDQYFGVISESADKNNRESNLSTFYPNAPDAASAAILEVTPGAELRGIEIHIRRGRTYEIRGRIQNTSASPNPQGTNITLYPKGAEPMSIRPHMFYVQEKTVDFQFKDLPPGTYVIETRTQSSTKDAAGEVTRTTTLIGRTEVTVGDANVEGVVLPLGTAMEIAGSIKREGNAPASNSHPRVTLRPKVINPYIGGGSSAEVGDDWSFHVRSLMPETYELDVGNLPDGNYVKSTRFDGQDITGKDLDLTAGNGGELQILISPNAADVTGILRNKNGDAVTTATVQLFDETHVKSTSTTDQTGAFHLKNLAPGEYKIFAWEDTSSGITQDPEFRKHFEPVVVKLAEKSHDNVELKLIPKDAIETEAAKVQ